MTVSSLPPYVAAPTTLTGGGTTGVGAVLEYARSMRKAYGPRAGRAVMEATPTMLVDCLRSEIDFESLGLKYTPLPAISVATLKIAMSSPAMQHIATALSASGGSEDATTDDGNRVMAVGTANFVLRGEMHAEESRTSLSNARDADLAATVSHLRKVDFDRPTRSLFTFAAFGTTGNHSDMLATSAKANSRLSGAKTDNYLVVFGPGRASVKDTIRRLGNTAATVVKLDAAQSFPRLVSVPVYGENKAPLQLGPGEKLAKSIVYVTADAPPEKIQQHGAHIMEYCSAFSGPAEARFQNQTDGWCSEGAHFTVMGVGSSTYSPTCLVNGVRISGQRILTLRLLQGEPGPKTIDISAPISKAKAKAAELAAVPVNVDLKSVLTEALDNIAAVPAKSIKSIVPKREKTLYATAELTRKKLKEESKAFLNEFASELDSFAAETFRRNGLDETEDANAIKAFEIIHAELSAGAYRPTLDVPKHPWQLLESQRKEATADFDAGKDSLFGRAGRARHQMQATYDVLQRELEDAKSTALDEFHTAVIMLANEFIRRLKNTRLGLQASITDADAEFSRATTPEPFGFCSMLPTRLQINRRCNVTWTPATIEPLVARVIAADLSEVGLAIPVVIEETMQLVTVPMTQSDFLAELPEADVTDHFNDLKANSRIQPGVDHDAVKPGRIPVRHVTIVMPPGTPFESKLIRLFTENLQVPSILHWNRPNEFRVHICEPGVFLLEINEVRAAIEKVGPLDAHFWQTRPTPFADPKFIVEYRPSTGRDIDAAEKILTSALGTNNIMRNGAEFQIVDHRLAQRLGLPGKTLGKGITETLDNLAANSSARAILDREARLSRDQLGIDGTLGYLRDALDDAAALVPASFLSRFRELTESEIDSLETSRKLASRARRLVSNGNGDTISSAPSHA